MKKFLVWSLILSFVVLLGPVNAIAAESTPNAVPHSKEFEKMKGLVGVWEGSTGTGKGRQVLKVAYELTSAGNTILERLFVGLPHEMVTVYYDYAGKLTMTHYCSLGNQPHMDLTKSGDKTIVFELSKRSPNLVSIKEAHMHALKIDFNGRDNITQTWMLYEGGKKKADTVIELKRLKPSK